MSKLTVISDALHNILAIAEDSLDPERTRIELVQALKEIAEAAETSPEFGTESTFSIVPLDAEDTHPQLTIGEHLSVYPSRHQLIELRDLINWYLKAYPDASTGSNYVLKGPE